MQYSPSVDRVLWGISFILCAQGHKAAIGVGVRLPLDNKQMLYYHVTL